MPILLKEFKPSELNSHHLADLKRLCMGTHTQFGESFLTQFIQDREMGMPQDDTHHVAAALFNGCIIGWSLAQEFDWGGKLVTFNTFVIEGRRKMGLGKTLASMAILKARETIPGHLRVWNRDDRTKSFYRSLSRQFPDLIVDTL